MAGGYGNCGTGCSDPAFVRGRGDAVVSSRNPGADEGCQADATDYGNRQGALVYLSVFDDCLCTGLSLGGDELV